MLVISFRFSFSNRKVIKASKQELYFVINRGYKSQSVTWMKHLHSRIPFTNWLTYSMYLWLNWQITCFYSLKISDINFRSVNLPILSNIRLWNFNWVRVHMTSDVYIIGDNFWSVSDSSVFKKNVCYVQRQS